jgi:hypothetical protein
VFVDDDQTGPTVARLDSATANSAHPSPPSSAAAHDFGNQLDIHVGD